MKRKVRSDFVGSLSSIRILVTLIVLGAALGKGTFFFFRLGKVRDFFPVRRFFFSVFW